MTPTLSVVVAGATGAMVSVDGAAGCWLQPATTKHSTEIARTHRINANALLRDSARVDAEVEQLADTALVGGAALIEEAVLAWRERIARLQLVQAGPQLFKDDIDDIFRRDAHSILDGRALAYGNLAFVCADLQPSECELVRTRRAVHEPGVRAAGVAQARAPVLEEEIELGSSGLDTLIGHRGMDDRLLVLGNEAKHVVQVLAAGGLARIDGRLQLLELAIIVDEIDARFGYAVHRRDGWLVERDTDMLVRCRRRRQRSRQRRGCQCWSRSDAKHRCDNALTGTGALQLQERVG